MGVTGILDTAKQALLAQQAALQVVGQNIANVNTPGYSRERPVMLPEETSRNGIMLRGGVSVDRIQRVFDQFIIAQRNVATSRFQAAKEQADQLGRVEVLVNDLGVEDGGLSGALERFFESFQDLANHPQGIPERNGVLQHGNLLTGAIHDLHTGFQNLNRDLNSALKDELSEVNRLVSEIANLNGQIQQIESDPKATANALRGQRDEMVGKLSEKIALTSFETDSNDFTVLLGTGRPLIEGERFNTLVAVADLDNPGNLQVRMQDQRGNLKDVTANLTDGKIQGLLQMRDALLPAFTSHLDRLAAQLTSSVNQLHSTGYGLDGSTGNNFFVPRQASGRAVSDNTGGGVLQNVAVFDPTQITLDDYRLQFTSDGPPPTFDIINTTTGENVATAQPYTAGASIRFAGLEVVITQATTPPQTGDAFTISTTKDAAKHIAVDTAVSNVPEKIAAGTTPQSGDNANALSLSVLRDQSLIDGNTFNEFHGVLVSNIGLERQNSSLLAEQRELVVREIENRRESVSGVSLDEEQLDLIRFQQAFAAAANFVRIADEMAATILSLVQ